MRRLFLLLACLLCVTEVQAQKFKVNTPKTVTGPAGWAERADKRTARTKVFQSPYDSLQRAAVISSAPLHYFDDKAGWVELNYYGVDTSGVYDKIIRRGGGKMDIYYSTKKPGALKVSRRNGWLEYTPAWDTTNISVVVDINDNGWKETLILDEKSPTRLAWGFDYTSALEKEAKGKGRIKNILAQTVAELGEYKAWNQRNEPIAVTTTYTADSLIVSIPAIMAGDTVYLDPYVQDTAHTDSSRAVGFYSQARSATAAAYSEGRLYVHHQLDDGTVGRSYISYDISFATQATVVDSAFIRWVNTSGLEGAGHDSTIMVKSSSSGVGAGGSFISFDGWASSGAYSPTVLSDTLTGMATPDTTYFRLNATARAVLLDSLGIGQFSVHALNLGDIKDVQNAYFANATTSFGPDLPLLVIYYQVANPPGVSTVDADTLRYVQRELYGTIDSTGGSNLTVRGFQILLNLLWSDTSTVTDTGSYTAGAFSHLSPLLLPDTLYLVRAVGINPGNTSYGAWDTLATADSSGTDTVTVTDTVQVGSAEGRFSGGKF